MSCTKTSRTHKIKLSVITLTLNVMFFSAPLSAATPVTECKYNTFGRTVDGSNFWNTVGQNASSVQIAEINCEIDQFSLNNFLYLVGDDGSGHPRFMSYTPWYNLFPKKGAPVVSTSYNALQSTYLNKSANQEQAGDAFHLLDVNNNTTSYDLRVNQTFFDYVSSNKIYTKTAMKAQKAAFNKNSAKNGIWLPPTNTDASKPGAVEIKTSWRDFGDASKNLCPSDIMHCETDAKGNAWGLVGMHLAQKTIDHGELIWATFEHVANSPDCESGSSNPIGKNPVDPMKPGQTINANKNIPELSDVTGWSYFNYGSYTTTGGKGNSCPYPGQKNGEQELCLKSPGSAKTSWNQVNVCRTQALPVVTDSNKVCEQSMSDSTNLTTVACLNNSLSKSFPSSLATKWQYYQLVGMEWLFNGLTSAGAVTTGCFTYDENNGKNACPKYKPGSAPNYGRSGSTKLANTTMETWMQANVYLNKDTSATDCLACHQPQTTTYQGDMSHIFDRISQD